MEGKSSCPSIASSAATTNDDYGVKYFPLLIFLTNGGELQVVAGGLRITIPYVTPHEALTNQRTGGFTLGGSRCAGWLDVCVCLLPSLRNAKTQNTTNTHLPPSLPTRSAGVLYHLVWYTSSIQPWRCRE